MNSSRIAFAENVKVTKRLLNSHQLNATQKKIVKNIILDSFHAIIKMTTNPTITIASNATRNHCITSPNHCQY